jgi:mannitol-1-phosphate 5-dehydrogenase
VFAYLGWLRGYTFLHEAAHDDEIRVIAEEAFEESSRAQISEYGFLRRDQEIMLKLALQKYRDTRSPDPIERNARDSRRKLSPEDRLLGPANLALKHSISPAALAIGIAAALHYNGSDDAGTQHVQSVLRQYGLARAIEECCGVNIDSPMGKLIIAAAPKIATFTRTKLR